MKMSIIKIKYVWLDDTGCDKSGKGILLGVDLENGSCIMLPLDSKADDLFFHDIIAGKVGEPKTDGERVYWDNGARLTFQDMLAMLCIKNKVNYEGAGLL